uniref:Uncharacterized protein n=1 Tax=Myoviridae sp. ctdyF5 TaxID=2825144 RepID=A0A8S5U7L7_9CAUD|nr:MAG TPA: hypothetical protein [Myoviridae sp. ctdyF5]
MMRNHSVRNGLKITSESMKIYKISMLSIDNMILV